MKLKEKTHPVRYIGFDKYKHKVNKWIAKAMIKSIWYKIQVYKVLMGTAHSELSFAVRKQDISLYKKILKFYKKKNNASL